MLGDVDDSLLAPPVNVLRLSLHPLGLAPRIANLSEWRAHVLDRLRRQVDATDDPVLSESASRAARLPRPGTHSSPRPPRDYAGIVVPFELRTPAGVLAFFGTTTVFGTPMDITLAELAVEAFFPADDFTDAIPHR